MDELVTVCNRCGAQSCVGKEACDYDGLPHDTADVPAVKLARATRAKTPKSQKENDSVHDHS